MKAFKKPINKLLSGLTAMFLAITTFGGALAEPLYAAAADTSFTINVNIYADGTKSEIEPMSASYIGTGGNSKKFSILAWVYEKGDPDNIVGFKTEPFDPTTSGDFQFTFTGLFPFGTDGSEVPREWWDPSAASVKYNSDQYGYDYRIVWCYQHDSDSGVWNYNQVFSNKSWERIGKTTFPDYRYERDGDTFDLIHEQIAFDLDITADTAATFTADDLYDVLVKITHQSSNPDNASSYTYYRAPLVLNGETSKKFEIQTATEAKWIDSNGNHDPKKDERYNGLEPKVEVTLVKKESADITMNAITSGANCAYVPNGGTVKNYKVSYSDRKEKVEGSVKTYSLSVDLKEIVPTDDYDFRDVLGNIAVNFGITADRFEQQNHMQTNFATNYFHRKSNGFRPDLADPDGGSIYIGNFVNFKEDKTVDSIVTEANDQLLDVEEINAHSKHPTDYAARLFTPFPTNVKLMQNDRSDYLVINQMSSDDIRNNVVDPAIAHFSAMSDVLAAKDANVSVLGNSLDVTSFPENVTLYVDGDSLLDNDGNLPTLQISKRPNQTIVFNFKNSTKVRINQYKVRVLLENGEWADSGNNDPNTGFTKTEESQVYRSKYNKWYDKYVMRDIIFNVNAVKENVTTEVGIDSSAGVFVIKNPNSITTMHTTSTGWAATAGYFTNLDGEWHFPYSELEDINGTTVYVTKCDITGENEIEGAQLRIYKSADVNDDGTIKHDYIGEEDNGEAPYLKGWTSEKDEKTGSVERAFRLVPGNYTLLETGGDFEYEGMTYSVTPSIVRFSITDDGKVKVESQDSVKQQADADADEGYYLFDGTNKLTVCDASATVSHSADITLSKKGITGESELAGATITIYNKADYDRNGDEAAAVKTWTSDGTNTKTFTLNDGSYVIKETGGEFTVGDNVYKVLTSVLEFTIEDGEVTYPQQASRTADET
ncbi:MAG: hypothetical protein IKO27_08760, partial [Ruminococcus sp.]|nr:hypothetical protein [Ruminococcus sp.]